MKYVSLLSSQFRLLIVPAILLLLLNSCSRSMQFMQSSVVPAAEGKAKVKKDGNGNYSINVKVSNLAEPGNLTPPRKNYVVWMETTESSMKNLGMLKSSHSMFSKALKGSLNTVNPFEPRRIFITAEDDGSIAYPYGPTILTTSSN